MSTSKVGKVVERLREPSTWVGLGGLSLAVPNVIGAGGQKAEIARQGVETVASGLAGGLGLIPSLLLALGSALGIVLREGRR